MIWFLLTFLGIYCAMHTLVFWGIQPLLKAVPGLPATVGLWMGLMIVAPVAVRMLDRNGFAALARPLAWLGYSWMGLLFLAFCMLLPILCWDAIAMLLERLHPSLPHLTLRGPTCALLVVIGTLITGMYGFYEAAHLRIERLTLASDKLPPGSPPIRLVQISDLHLGLLHRERALVPVIDILRHLQPDLLVVTGDMVDAQMDHLDGLSDMWRGIAPPLGKFAVTGNHEVYAGLEQSLDFLRRSGFTLLRGTSVAVGPRLLLTGVDDPATEDRAPASATANGSMKGRFRILLKHRPVIAPDQAGSFDLQLSGHAHRGQIFPFNLLTHLVYPMQSGLYLRSDGGALYASRGTGSWGPPMRLGAPPEITLFELVPVSSGEATGPASPSR